MSFLQRTYSSARHGPIITLRQRRRPGEPTTVPQAVRLEAGRDRAATVAGRERDLVDPKKLSVCMSQPRKLWLQAHSISQHPVENGVAITRRLSLFHYVCRKCVREGIVVNSGDRTGSEIALSLQQGQF